MHLLTIIPTLLTLLVALIIVIITIVCCCVLKNRIHKQDGKAEDPCQMVGIVNQAISSGSGGLPFIVQRTVARNVTLYERIGMGRFGTVFVGTYQGEKVAVKKFDLQKEVSWTKESDIYNTVWLRHVNILGFIANDVFSDVSITELWLILQYHPHGSLYDYLKRQTISPNVMMRMAISTSRGLTFLHTSIRGVLDKPAVAHRDFKSGNVLVKNDLECCICDFGHAVIESVPNQVSSPISIQQGTRRYMSPEILAETMDVTVFSEYLQTDMYAFGLILWELCTRCNLEIRNCK